MSDESQARSESASGESASGESASGESASGESASRESASGESGQPPEDANTSSAETSVDDARSSPRRGVGSKRRSRQLRRALQSDRGATRDTLPAPPPSTDALGVTHPSDPAAAIGGERDLLITLNDDNSLISSLADSDGGDEPIVDPLIGMEVAERYRILEQIGRGGMGIVYRVEHTRIGKLLAMKLLTGELSMNKEIVRRFKQEALTVSKLSSPHTVQVFDYGVFNHLTYLVMELVDGHHLARILKREGPMGFARLGPLVVQVCASLAEAHDKGIVHRDVKPENIMLIPDVHGMEVAKVLDFGLAKLRENPDLNAVTLQGAVVGTPYFMSPEQVTGDDVDGRTDIYSLGAVMFKALTGTYPFQAKTPMGMFTKHLSEPPPSARERAPALDIPPRISELVQQCMSKSPDDRPDTVEDLCNVLVAELQAMGLETSDQLYFQARRSQPNQVSAVVRRKQELAQQLLTRADLENYERKLRRTRYGAWASLSIMLAAAAAGGIYLWQRSQQVALDREHEPNNVAAEATELALGVELAGQIGARMEPGVGDRDFYLFDKLDDADISLQVSGLPNMPLCLLLYRSGFQQPMAQYCGGAAGQDIQVQRLRLDSGRYFLAVLQDMQPTRELNGFVIENISDRYELLVKPAITSAATEVEPNDSADGAWLLAADTPVEGTLGWVDDIDVLCAEGDGQQQMSWEISDDKRPAGAVLEVTPLGTATVLPPVRVHPEAAQPFGRPRFEADVNSPWVSPPLPAGRDSCVRLELTGDPWVTSADGPQPSGARYRVSFKIISGSPAP